MNTRIGYWTDANGRRWRITNMTERHLRNAAIHCLRKENYAKAAELVLELTERSIAIRTDECPMCGAVDCDSSFEPFGYEEIPF